MHCRKSLLNLAIGLALSSLTACGGSSGGSSDGEAPNTGNNITLNLQVLGGYIADTLVFADLNNNFQQDENEPVGYTDATGHVQLTLPQNRLPSAVLKVYAIAHKGDANVVLGETTTIDNDVVLSTAVFIHNNELVTQNVQYVNPFTTLASNKIKSETNDSSVEYQDTFTELLCAIAKQLGIDSASILSDYNDPQTAKTDPNKFKVLISDEILIRNGVLPTSLKQTATAVQQTTLASTDSNTLQDEFAHLKDWQDAINEVTYAVQNNSTSPINQVITQSYQEITDKMGKGFSSLAGGVAEEYRCGVTYNKNVYCWGNNASGQLGNPQAYQKDGRTIEGNGYDVVDLFSAELVPVVLKDGSLLANVKKVATGNEHACAVTYDGEVYCWGNNNYGQLGIGTINKDKHAINAEIYPYAQKVVKGYQDSATQYLTNISDLALSYGTSCALNKFGEVYCWGLNNALQLGSEYPGEDNQDLWATTYSYSTLNPRSLYGFLKGVAYPVKVKMPETVDKINKLIAGYWGFCSLAKNKDPHDLYNLYCWGNDTSGLIP